MTRAARRHRDRARRPRPCSTAARCATSTTSATHLLIVDHRSRLRLRPRAAHAHPRARAPSSPRCPRSGSTSSPSIVPQPPRHHRRGGHGSAGRAAPRPAARSHDARAARPAHRRRVRRARLHHGLGLEGLPGRAARSAASPIRPGMREAEAFDQPLFTPATKAESGHDENIDFETFAGIVGPEHGRGGARPLHPHLRGRTRPRPGARHHPGRHEVRVRPHRRAHHAHRRGADARFLALLGRRGVPPSASRRRASTSRSCATTCKAAGWDGEPPAPAPARRDRRAHRRPLPRGPGARLTA